MSRKMSTKVYRVEKRVKHCNYVKKQVDSDNSAPSRQHPSLNGAKRGTHSLGGPSSWDKTTAVTPREYAQKEPEELAAQYPQYVKFL
ncbi:hypothetical protein B0H14DRAFT_3476393 [Mycena olivaceomarginata]|nr:hypothetical protein B0H14DRAFT_3476393 [Mycena olivaceomarginata]